VPVAVAFADSVIVVEPTAVMVVLAGIPVPVTDIPTYTMPVFEIETFVITLLPLVVLPGMV
jgi:hypothetical protein